MSNLRSFKPNYSLLHYGLSAALAVAIWVIRVSNASIYDGARLPELTDGTAFLPYQFRALMPWVVSCLRATGLGEVFAGGVDWFASGAFTRLSDAHFDGCPPGLLFWYLLLDLIAVLSIIPLTLRLVGAVKSSLPTVALMRWPAVYLMLYMLAWNYTASGEGQWWFSSDFLGIALFMTGMVCLFEQRLRALYAILILGTLNKETTLFLVPLFFFFYDGPLPLWRVTLHAGAMLGIWAGVKSGLATVYGANRGFLFHPNVPNNLELLGELSTWFELFKNCGYLWLPVLFLQFGLKGRLAKALIWTHCVYLAGIFFGGRVSELRAYGEVLPVVMLLLLLLWEARKERSLQAA